MSDLILEAWVSGLIEAAKLRGWPKAGDSWRPGKQLRLLIAGYNGARNTGEEVRVEEIVRQFRRVLGEKNIQLSVLTLNPEFTQGYYGDATQVHLPFIFPPFLYREVPRYDGVVSSCGAMFMSKFSNVPSIMMIEALGIASAQGKLAVAYGGEAGAMDRTLASMCRRYCSQTSMIIRNEESRSVLQKLGISSRVGTDTAWTFEPLGGEFGRKILREAGWDGSQPVLATCPNNPFWWPVRPSLLKATAWALMNAYEDSRYESIYFHECGARAKQGYERYVTGLARAIDLFRKERGVFPILVGMETFGRRSLSADLRAPRRYSRVHVGAVQRLSACEYSPLLRLDGFFALPRDRDFHGGPRPVGGRHHGRAYPKFDARTWT